MTTTAVMNDNGNVAKSTLTNYGIFPRLQNSPEVIYCESGNSVPGRIEKTTHGKVKEFGAEPEEFSAMIEYLVTASITHDVVVDFGSTDSERMRSLFVNCPGSLEAFDLFVIPHAPTVKDEDTYKTIKFLQLAGVPAEKIRVIFTLVPLQKKIDLLFARLIELQRTHRNFTLDMSAVLYQNQLPERIKDSDYTVEDFLSDTTDWKEKIRELHPNRDKPKVAKEIEFATWMHLNKMYAASMVKDLDAIYASIMSPAA